MISSKISLLFLMSLTRTQSARLPTQTRSQASPSSLGENAGLLKNAVEPVLRGYQKKCNCKHYSKPFNLVKTISKKTIRKSIKEVQKSLYPFTALLINITEKETNQQLKKELEVVKNRLTDTYNTAITMMKNANMSLNNLPKDIVSATSLANKTRNSLNTGGYSNNVIDTRNYFIFHELRIFAVDICNAMKSLNQGAVKITCAGRRGK